MNGNTVHMRYLPKSRLWLINSNILIQISFGKLIFAFCNTDDGQNQCNLNRQYMCVLQVKRIVLGEEYSLKVSV